MAAGILPRVIGAPSDAQVDTVEYLEFVFYAGGRILNEGNQNSKL